MTTQIPTPMMAQWQECKEEAKDALLLFRLGDFYEAFHDDATIISKEVGVTLTARQGVPMCGVPFHTAENYIDKLLAKGFKVAVAEQIDDPKNTKGLVRRAISRIVTPATTISTNLIPDKKNNFFASIYLVGKTFGLSYLDISTGEFFAAEHEEEGSLYDALHRIRPREILVEKNLNLPHFFEKLSLSFPFLLNVKEGCDPKTALATLTLHFDLTRLDRFGMRSKTAAIASAGMLLLYLKEELGLHLEQVLSIEMEQSKQTMNLDHSTLRHLELDRSILEFLDETATPMGGRLLASWLKAPLLNVQEIKKRQDYIARFLSSWDELKSFKEELSSVRDLERLMMKVVTGSANPRDLLALGLSLAAIPRLKKIIEPLNFEDAHTLFDTTPTADLILNALNPTPPIRLGEGEIFKEGFDPELDTLRQLAKDSMSWMGRYQNELREQTQIKTLKVGYTRAFGYYIEVTRAQSEKIPATFHRRQTLVNAERFITDELKNYEHQVLTAEERSKAIEAEHFSKLRAKIASFAPQIYQTAKTIARLDTLFSLAKIAKYHGYTCPVIDESDILEIRGGRHPIVERSIGRSSYIANDTSLNTKRQMMLITGPNMAGKSTYIRQVALIVILAQMGSYVPADFVHIGIIDQVLSRIGASDDLIKGQSTFMVEMAETAHILSNATSRSLVILDEIGRGTSTYDGISIAWSVAHYLLTQINKQAKTLFATHYWELTRLEEHYPHALNFQTAIQETPSGIVFLRKIIAGGTDKSYGIHVAKLAGLPPKVLRKAEEVLALLEKGMPRKKEPEVEQLSFFSAPVTPPILEEIKSLDPNTLSPIQALEKLFAWKKLLT